MPTRSRLSGRPSWRTSSVRSSGLGPNWSPSSLVARSPGAKNGKSDMSSYLRDTTLVNGSSDNANTFLSSASTSSFVATLDGMDNTVEISPDGTRWISIPIAETGANSSTFVGTIGFDTTAVRLTTNTSILITSLISDFTGTSTLFFQDGDLAGNGFPTFLSDGSL